MKSLKKGNILLIVIIIVLIASGVGYVFLRKSPQGQKNIEENNFPSSGYVGTNQSNEIKSSSLVPASVKKSSSSKNAFVPKTGITGGTTGVVVNTGTIDQLSGDINALLNTADPISDLTEPDLDVNLGL